MIDFFIEIFFMSERIYPDIKMVFDDGEEREINMYYYDDRIIRRSKINTLLGQNYEKTMKLDFNINDILFDVDHEGKIIHTQLGFLQEVFEKENLTQNDLNELNKEFEGTRLDGYKIQFGILMNPRLLLIERQWFLENKEKNIVLENKFEWMFIQNQTMHFKNGFLYQNVKFDFNWEKRDIK